MDIAMYVTLDDDATPHEIATAMQVASEQVCAILHERKTPMLIDERCELHLSNGKLRSVVLNRFA